MAAAGFLFLMSMLISIFDAESLAINCDIKTGKLHWGKLSYSRSGEELFIEVSLACWD